MFHVINLIFCVNWFFHKGCYKDVSFYSFPFFNYGLALCKHKTYRNQIIINLLLEIPVFYYMAALNEENLQYPTNEYKMFLLATKAIICNFIMIYINECIPFLYQGFWLLFCCKSEDYRLLSNKLHCIKWSKYIYYIYGKSLASSMLVGKIL